jgi:hypothetical protein
MQFIIFPTAAAERGLNCVEGSKKARRGTNLRPTPAELTTFLSSAAAKSWPPTTPHSFRRRETKFMHLTARVGNISAF